MKRDPGLRRDEEGKKDGATTIIHARRVRVRQGLVARVERSETRGFPPRAQ
jgi:hypothetical protein